MAVIRVAATDAHRLPGLPGPLVGGFIARVDDDTIRTLVDDVPAPGAERTRDALERLARAVEESVSPPDGRRWAKLVRCRRRTTGEA